MKPSPLDREIRSRIDTLLTDISALVKRSALDAVNSALGGAATPSAAAPQRGPGRARKDVSAPKAARGKRVKRTSEDVQATATAFLAYVKANQGQRLEEIAKGLGVPTKDLKLPVIKLLEARAVRTEGQKRGTRYFAGSRRKSATAKARGAASKKGKRGSAKKTRRAGRKARAKATLVPIRKRAKPSPPAVTTTAASPEDREAVSAA